MAVEEKEKKCCFGNPGQGKSAFPGMGLDKYNENAGAKSVYEKADELTSGFFSKSLSKICFEGMDRPLNTKEMQLAVVVTGVAHMVSRPEVESWTFENGIIWKPGKAPEYLTGMSVGALVAQWAAGVFTIDEIIRLVIERASAMHEAEERNPFKWRMLVVILSRSKDLVKVERVVGEREYYIFRRRIYITNINTEKQILVVGVNKEINRLELEMDRQGIKAKITPLEIKVPVHCSFMNHAARKFARFIDKNRIYGRDPRVKIINDMTGEVMTTAEEVVSYIKRQVNHQIRWAKVKQRLEREGVTFIEVGSGNVLEKLTVPSKEELELSGWIQELQTSVAPFFKFSPEIKQDLLDLLEDHAPQIKNLLIKVINFLDKLTKEV